MAKTNKATDNVAETTPTDTTAAQTATVAEPQSEKLTALNQELSDKWALMLTFKPGTKEARDANLEVYKVQKNIDAEIANIKQAENQKVLDEQRNQRVAMYDESIVSFGRAAGLSEEQIAEAQKNESYKALRENCVNALLAKYAASKPTGTIGGNGQTSAPKGATSKAIIEMWEKNRAAGMSDTDNVKDIIASGQSRGTTGAVTLAWRREHGEAE